jgi:hypothetical protein
MDLTVWEDLKAAGHVEEIPEERTHSVTGNVPHRGRGTFP